MNEVKVKKADLLEILKENRRNHTRIFLEALEGYRQKFIEELEKRLEDAKNGRHFDQRINLTEPVDHTKDYDRIISMLEMSVDEYVLLDEGQYAEYVMDDWSWKRQFVASNSLYTNVE